MFVIRYVLRIAVTLDCNTLLKTAIPYVILADQFTSTAYFSDKDMHEALYKTNKKMTESIIRNIDKMKIE